MLCEPLMQSMCSLRHQCHSHGSLPHPVHHCPACAPEALCVVHTFAERIEMLHPPARCAARAPLLYPRTTALPVRRCPACASLPCLCTRSAACRECPRRGDQNACSRARCAARAPLLYPRTTALPVRRCPACAPEARRVVNALAEGIKMPARAPDAPPVRRCSTRAPLPCPCVAALLVRQKRGVS